MEINTLPTKANIKVNKVQMSRINSKGRELRLKIKFKNKSKHNQKNAFMSIKIPYISKESPRAGRSRKFAIY